MAKSIFKGKIYGTYDPASTNELGVVKPDGTTVDTDEEGILFVKGDLAKTRVAAIAASSNDVTTDWVAEEYYVTIDDSKVYYVTTAATKKFDTYSSTVPDDAIEVEGIATVTASDYPVGIIVVDTTDSNAAYIVAEDDAAEVTEVTDSVIITDIQITEAQYATTFDLKTSKTIHFWVD